MDFVGIWVNCMRPVPLVFLLISVVLISGCINLPFFGSTETVGGGLFMKMRADPSTTFAGSNLRVDIDVDNQNVRNISDVTVNVFDSGILNLQGPLVGERIINTAEPAFGRCNKVVDAMRPRDFDSLACFFLAPESIQQDFVTTRVSAYARYTTDIPFVQIVDIMSEDEYVTRQQQGQIQQKPQSYSYEDKNVRINVEFSEPLPLVVRKRQDISDSGYRVGDKEYFMHITVNNIGNGFMDPIRASQFYVRPVAESQPGSAVQVFPDDVLYCPDLKNTAWSITPIGKQFPKITCKIQLPASVRVLENYGILFNLRYVYEVRDSVEVKIVR